VRLYVRVRVNWPVPAVALLDAVTVAVGGAPQTVQRDEAHPCPVFGMNRVSNDPDQGLDALAWVLWSEDPDQGVSPDEPEPPALVMVVMINTPGTLDPGWQDVEHLHNTNVLPTVRDWLDQQGVPRTAWWWCCEDLRYFPGTVDIAALTTRPDELRDLHPQLRWSPQQT
jgi:hypothetical protein